MNWSTPVRTAAVACLTAALLCSTAALETQAREATLRYAGTTRDGLLAIDSNGSHVLAGGFGGGLLESTDAGQSWADQPVLDARSSILGLALGRETSLAVGQGGRAWRRDGDEAWEPMSMPSQERWLNVDLIDDGLAVAVGGFGALAVSKDHGRTWTPVSLDWSAMLDEWYEPHLYDVRIRNGVVTVVGEFGLVLRSSDNGASWQGVSYGDESFFALHLGDDGKGYAVGQDGYIAMTQDGGASWESCQFRGDSNLFGVSASGSRVVAVGMRRILVSDDHCDSFQPVGSEAQRRGWWQAATFDEGKGEFLVVGSGARILSIDRQ